MNLSRVNGNYLQKLAEPQENASELDLSQSSDLEANRSERSISIKNILNTFKKHQEPAIASVFFRFSHRSGDNEVLNNQDQLRIVDHIMDKIYTNMNFKAKEEQKRAALTDGAPRLFSATYLRFFDVVE
jgi:hypothetical protein